MVGFKMETYEDLELISHGQNKSTAIYRTTPSGEKKPLKTGRPIPSSYEANPRETTLKQVEKAETQSHRKPHSWSSDP